MKISVLVASADCGKYIKSCLKSIYKNSYADWELIVFDDQSRDDSLRIIRDFASAPKRQHKVKVLTAPKKLYCGAAFELLAQNVTGELVCVVDGDDVITKDALEKIHMLYEKYPNIDYIYTQHYTCSEDLKTLGNGISSLPENGLDLATSWERRKHCFSHMRTCRASMLKYNIFNRDLKFSVDKYMGMMLESHGNGGFFKDVTYLYRMRPLQLTNKFRDQREKVKSHCINSIREYRKKNNLVAKPIISVEL